MQLSFNVIKNNNIVKQGNKEIITLFDNISERENKEINARNNIESYENLARTMIENARKQGEQIVSRAFSEAQTLEEDALEKSKLIQEEAYNSAYNKGYIEGQEKGYQVAYESTIVKANEECENIKRNIDQMLRDAQKEYDIYINDKRNELNNLILSLAENVLRREVKDSDGINSMIFQALEESKTDKSFIIRTNSLYKEEIKSQIENWKDTLAFKGDIFVIADESVEEGSAIIDKGNGKVVVSISLALEKIKEILEGVD